MKGYLILNKTENLIVRNRSSLPDYRKPGNNQKQAVEDAALLMMDLRLNGGSAEWLLKLKIFRVGGVAVMMLSYLFNSIVIL